MICVLFIFTEGFKRCHGQYTETQINKLLGTFHNPTSHVMGKSSGKSDDGGKEKKRKLAMAAEHQDENENDKGESPDASILRLTSSYVYLRR